MDFAINHDGGGETAATDATHRFDGEFAVRGRDVETDAEFTFKFEDDVLAALQVARGAEANLNEVAAGLLEFEEVVERQHAVDFGERHVEHGGDFERDFARDVAVGLLDAVHDHDEVARFAFPLCDEVRQFRRESHARGRLF